MSGMQWHDCMQTALLGNGLCLCDGWNAAAVMYVWLGNQGRECVLRVVQSAHLCYVYLSELKCLCVQIVAATGA